MRLRPSQQINGVTCYRCTSCHEWKPAEAYYTSLMRGVRYLRSACKVCSNIDRRPNAKPKPVQMKPRKVRRGTGLAEFEASRRRYQIAMGNKTARVVLAHCPVQVKAQREVFVPRVELETE